MPETPVICIEIIKGFFSLIIAYRVFHWGKQAFKENTLLKIAIVSYIDAIKGITNCNIELQKAQNLCYQTICAYYKETEGIGVKKIHTLTSELNDKVNEAQKNKISSSPVLSIYNCDLISKEGELITIYKDFSKFVTDCFHLNSGNPMLPPEFNIDEFDNNYESAINNIKQKREELQTLINNEYAATIHGKKTFSKNHGWIDK